MTNDGLQSRVNEDPRFLRVKKRDVKIKVDKRFDRMFNDEQFGGKQQVDRYGRKRKLVGKSADLERFYQRESGEEEEDSEKSVKSSSSVSSSESSSDASSESSSDASESEEAIMDEVLAAHPLVNTEAPLGDASRRLAVVNMDWDLVKAVDLFQLAHAFKPSTGLILSVKIYPSEFGKERMAKECLEGPPRELFDEVEEVSAGEREVDEQKLRKYQLERLRYYFAVIECDTVDTASAIYRQCDGTEFESSANFIDLRFIPDDVHFDEAEVTDMADRAARNYRPKPDVQTAALQQSKVTLTWDQDDPERQKATRALFYGHIDQEENDLRAYLASSSSSASESSDAEDAKQRYRQLLLSGEKENVFGRKSNDNGQLEVTFASGLTDKKKKKKDLDGDSDVDMEMTFNVTASEDSEESADETVFEAQQRKLKEKKRAKKEARLAEIKERREAERQANRKRKHEVDPEAEKKKAQLDLLLLDEQEEEDRHFDMREIVKQQKKKLKNKKEIKDDFNMDLNDPRFQAMYESHSFAIDPSNPAFKKTESMKQVIAERQKRLKPEH